MKTLYETDEMTILYGLAFLNPNGHTLFAIFLSLYVSSIIKFDGSERMGIW